MIDITSFGTDIGVYNTDVAKAKNILSVQVGALEYAPTVGIDLNFFLSEEFIFQNESFKTYLIQVLSQFGVNVASITDEFEALSRQYTFNIQPTDQGTGLIAR